MREMYILHVELKSTKIDVAEEINSVVTEFCYFALPGSNCGLGLSNWMIHMMEVDLSSHLCKFHVYRLLVNVYGIPSSSKQVTANPVFSARCNIYISRLCYDVSVCLSVRLSVTGVHWRIIANLGFEFRSKFTAHCIVVAERGNLNNNISRYGSHC